MLYADSNGNRIKAIPNTEAVCPYCKGEVIPKCGTMNIWHWAHRVHDQNCIYKEMSEWHRELQQKAEVLGWEIEAHIKYRIADCAYKGNIIELQKSPISTEEIIARNINYDAENKKINWIFDYRNKVETMDLTLVDDIVKFKQRWPKKSIVILFNYIDDNNKPVWGNVGLDIGYGKLIDVIKMYDNGNGYGKIYSIEEMLTIPHGRLVTTTRRNLRR